MLQSGWSLFCGYLQNVCVCLTLLLNSFMIYLIVEKSPKKIGKYKYLMLYISIFEIFYALLATVTKPFVHSYASRVIVIVDAKNSWFGRDFTKVLNSCICGFYGCSVTILAIHFMYRYGSLDKARRTHFEGWKFLMWCLVPIFYGIIWGLAIFFIFPEDKGFTEYIRKDIWDYFELKVEDIVYTGPYYYPEDKNGLGDIEPLACFGMFVLWFVIGSSSVVVIYYGFRCYITMKKLLSHSTSRFTQGLQHQLFKALVWQYVHSYTSRVIVIVDVKNSIFSRPVNKILNSLICGFYGCSVSIFAIHFMYRYGALDRRDIWDLFELPVEDIVYTGSYYYPEDKNGVQSMNLRAAGGMAVLWFVIGSSTFTVIYFGLSCYIKIRKIMKKTEGNFSKSLQRQLFRALVIQAAIPLLLLYIPCSIVFVCPLIQIDLGNMSAFISVSVAIYPAIDPLPTLLIIKNYRKATIEIFVKTVKLLRESPASTSSLIHRSSNEPCTPEHRF
ncbi:hypothetical protein GCK72_018382 [Caenorhabditis remanei]|uniref:Serpentine receptor class r-10 n=1 Tax=Caenorhabditis remanei TaxID=31234 RepID=A0A6A5G9M4_CAERE|nr:hypothetical protein GCK72_018382 [Caenorhabditis remanei]KAF1751828.1 hypothetical protein GCK72_018382 [Caenorhabditis remanei]